MTSPGTISSARSSIPRPSRITSARGATSSARLSSVSFAFTSWRIPIAELTIAITPNSASAQSPWLRMRMKKTRMIALKSVRTFARTIDRTDRLVSCSTGPSPRSRCAASASLSPRTSVVASDAAIDLRMNEAPTRAPRGGSVGPEPVLGDDLAAEVPDPDRAEDDLGVALTVVVDRAQRLRGDPHGRPRPRLEDVVADLEGDRPGGDEVDLLLGHVPVPVAAAPAGTGRHPTPGEGDLLGAEAVGVGEHLAEALVRRHVVGRVAAAADRVVAHRFLRSPVGHPELHESQVVSDPNRLP